MEIGRVRRTVMKLLPELGIAANAPNWELPLIADGQAVGCRFEFDQVRAFWFSRRQRIEFYGPDWAPLKEAGIDSGNPV
jgi:hypothetical protein